MRTHFFDCSLSELKFPSFFFNFPSFRASFVSRMSIFFLVFFLSQIVTRSGFLNIEEEIFNFFDI